MKLTIDARMLQNTGIGVYLKNILLSPLLSGYQVYVLHRKEDRAFFDASPFNLIEYNVPIYSVKELLMTISKTCDTDIFWSPHFNVPLINFASRLKICTIHDVYHLAHLSELSRMQRNYAQLMLRKAVDSSDIIFTVSNFSKSEITKYLPCDPAKIHVVYNGVDFDRFNKSYNSLQQKVIIEKYQLYQPFILFVGNLKPNKNLKNALLGYKDFIDHSNKGDPEYKFIITGKREGFITADESVTALLAEPFFKENVQFTGWVDDNDLPFLYRLASVFVFPSTYEGFGLPPLEAMASGCPVISSDTASLPEIYNDAALYFNPFDYTTIGEAFWKVLKDVSLRESLKNKGKLQAARYRWFETVQEKMRIIDLYLQT